MATKRLIDDDLQLFMAALSSRGLSASEIAFAFFLRADRPSASADELAVMVRRQVVRFKSAMAYYGLFARQRLPSIAISPRQRRSKKAIAEASKL